MSGITEQELQAMQARADAATPGPWDHSGESVYTLDETWEPYSGNSEVCECCKPAFWQGDRAFIAHAREDVPALIAEVRRLDVLSIALIEFVKGLELSEHDKMWVEHLIIESTEGDTEPGVDRLTEAVPNGDN